MALCDVCGRQKTLMVDETICVDCFEELPHEQEEAICRDLYSDLEELTVHTLEDTR